MEPNHARSDTMDFVPTFFEFTRFIPIILILAYAAICDHKTGHVPNQTWKYAPFGLISTILTLLFYPNLLTLTATSIALTTTLSLTLFYLGIWGGADAKALITIALCTPLTPLWSTPTMLPLMALALAGPIAITYTLVKQPKQFLHAKVRYLPFILAGYIITILLF